MSHHYSGPNIGFPRGDARLDLTDLYAFPKLGDPGKSIFIMDFHPSAGLNPPGPTTAEPFAPEARYELLIDTDGDAVADICYQVRFSLFEGGEQSATLRRFKGALAAETGWAGRLSLRESRSRQGTKDMWRRLVTIGSLPVGVVTPSSSTYWARSTNSSSLGISSWTKISAVLRWKCPIPFLDRKRLACGLAP